MSLLLKVLTGLVPLALLGAVSVTDPTGDAVGDGTIVAPTAPRYANSAIFDLQDVSIEVLQAASGGSIILLPAETAATEDDGAGGAAVDADAVVPAAPGVGQIESVDVRSVLYVTLGAIDVSEGTALGFGSVVIDVYLDGAPGGRETTLDGPGMLMPAGRGWDYAVRLTPDGASGFRYVAQPQGSATSELGEAPAEDANGAAAAEGLGLGAAAAAVDYQRVPVGVSLQGSTLTVELPWDFPDEVVVYALTGVHDPFNPTGWRPLAAVPSPWAYSGGEQLVPVVDLVAPDQEAQIKSLRTGVLPLPAVAVRDSGLLWLLLMAVGLTVAAAGLVLRRRVPGQVTGQLRTGLPPEPVQEPVVAPRPVVSAPLAASAEPLPAPEGTAPTSEDERAAVRSRSPGQVLVVETDSPGSGQPGADDPLAAADSATLTVSPDEAEPALSGISAFDSYVLSEELAENEEPDADGFDDVTRDLT